MQLNAVQDVNTRIVLKGLEGLTAVIRVKYSNKKGADLVDLFSVKLKKENNVIKYQERKYQSSGSIIQLQQTVLGYKR